MMTEREEESIRSCLRKARNMAAGLAQGNQHVPVEAMGLSLLFHIDGASNFLDSMRERENLDRSSFRRAGAIASELFNGNDGEGYEDSN
jgi:hypothetical protein